LIENTKKNFLDSSIIEFPGTKHNVTRLKTKNQIKKSQYNFFSTSFNNQTIFIIFFLLKTNSLTPWLFWVGMWLTGSSFFFLFFGDFFFSFLITNN
jgi:hypothetical protein